MTARTKIFGVPSKTLRVCLMLVAVCSMAAVPLRVSAKHSDLDVALGLAEMLRAARAVIGANQDRINDPSIGDKGLSGDFVLEAALENFKNATGQDVRGIDPESHYGRLLTVQMEAIRQVMEDNKASINKAGVGFKGFVPAIFARLVNERFKELIGDEAEIKVTAPAALVRNRKARPDPWETQAINDHLLSAEWIRDKVYAMETTKHDRAAFRVLVPEYYTTGCMACHGEPKGEMDVTGYPKEGGKVGELGGVISVTLFH